MDSKTTASKIRVLKLKCLVFVFFFGFFGVWLKKELGSGFYPYPARNNSNYLLISN